MCSWQCKVQLKPSTSNYCTDVLSYDSLPILASSMKISTIYIKLFQPNTKYSRLLNKRTGHLLENAKKNLTFTFFSPNEQINPTNFSFFHLTNFKKVLTDTRKSRVAHQLWKVKDVLQWEEISIVSLYWQTVVRRHVHKLEVLSLNFFSRRSRCYEFMSHNVIWLVRCMIFS